MSEKGRKDFSVAAIYRRKDGEIDAADVTGRLDGDTDPADQRCDMGGTGRKRELPGKEDGKYKKSSRKSPPATPEDDDLEDGDIATPKRDRYGEDDQPL
jgi:hypothetical protein